MAENNTDNAKAAAIVLIAGAIIVGGAIFFKQINSALKMRAILMKLF